MQELGASGGVNTDTYMVALVLQVWGLVEKLAPRGAWLRQKNRQEISCTVVALLVLIMCVSSDAL
jgi:uncharacterized protein YidB (DUF937 family)